MRINVGGRTRERWSWAAHLLTPRLESAPDQTPAWDVRSQGHTSTVLPALDRKLGHGSGARTVGATTLFYGRHRVQRFALTAWIGGTSAAAGSTDGGRSSGLRGQTRRKVRAGGVTSATGSRDLTSDFPAPGVALPHPTKSRVGCRPGRENCKMRRLHSLCHGQGL